jgi:hypothetical protein
LSTAHTYKEGGAQEEMIDLHMNIVQQIAGVGFCIMLGIWIRQKYQERKRGVKGKSCSTCVGSKQND